jgi:hypothetical protein
MRPILGVVLVLTVVLPAGKPVLAEEPAAARSEVLRLPGGAQVRVVRGPTAGRQAEAPAPAAPTPARTIAAVSGRTLWLLEDDTLTACFVRKTSYVDGYRIRCVGY